MEILLFLLLIFGSNCLEQVQNDNFVIDEAHREKTAQNLQENVYSLKEFPNSPQKISIQEPEIKKDNIITDEAKISSIAEKKLEEKVKDDSQNILDLNANNFKDFLNQNSHILVYFYTKDCEYCNEFNQSLSEINKKLMKENQNVKIASVELSDETETLFKEYNIEAVPEIKYFYQGNPSKYKYDFVEYFGESMNNFLEWIKRVFKISEFENALEMSHKLSIFGKQILNESIMYMKEVQTLEEVTKNINEGINKKVIMINCSYQWKETENKELGEFLKKSYLTHLDHHFFCTRNHSIFIEPVFSTFISFPTSELLLYVYEFKELENQQISNIPSLFSRIRLNNNISYKPKSSAQNHEKTQEYTNLSFIYHENMNRYLNQKVEYWTNQSVINVFTHNNPCFILIINNETRSKGVFKKYEEIKQKISKNPNLPPVKFYYTDLSVTPQSTTRIKKYLTGLLTSITTEYQYPLLAYLKPSENRVQKYFYEGKIAIEKIENWIVDIINDLEIESENIATLKMGGHETDYEIKEYFRSTPESLFPIHYTDKFREIYHSLEYSLGEKAEKLKIPQEFISHRNELKLINFYDMQVLLSNLHQKEFFVYVNWKNEIKSYELLNDITDWWESLEIKEENKNEKEIPDNKGSSDGKIEQNNEQINNEQKRPEEAVNEEKKRNTEIMENINVERKLIEKGTKNEEYFEHDTEEQMLKKFAQKTNIYILNYNNNDYPPVYWDSEGKEHKLEINYVPSILYFSADKKVTDKIEGIFNFLQVKMFILHQYKLAVSDSERSEHKIIPKSEGEKTEKAENTESARELSGLDNNQINFKKE